MNAGPSNRPVAHAASVAGEWCLYVCVLLFAYVNAGRAGSFFYFSGCAAAWFLIPAHLNWRSARATALVITPVIGVTVVLTAPQSLWPYLGAGAAYGVATRLAGRIPGPAAGVFGPPTWPGVAGASAGVIAVLIWEVTTVAVIAAIVAVVGAALSDSRHQKYLEARGRESEPYLPSVFFYAALGLCFAAGLRAAEPGMGPDPTSAIFFIPAWAVGAQLISTALPAADPRAVLSAPFVASIALAAMGPVEGPGLLFLYAAVAAAAGLTTGSQGAVRWPMLAALTAGAVWSSFGGADFDTTVWAAGVAVIAGGFATLIVAYRVTAPAHTGPVLEEESFTGFDTVPASENVSGETQGPIPLPEADLAPTDSLEIEALLILRAALEEARRIRAEALGRFKDHRLSPASAVAASKRQAQIAVEELEAVLNRLQARL